MLRMSIKLQTVLVVGLTLLTQWHVRSESHSYGYCTRDEEVREHIRRACAYDIKRSVSADANQANAVYNSFAELENFFKGMHAENQPEPEELSQLPVLYRHRPPPMYEDAKIEFQRRQQYNAKMEQQSLTNTNPPYQKFVLLEKLQPQNNPVVKLYYPSGNTANGYREEWYSPTASSRSAQVVGLSLVRKFGGFRIEKNPVELQELPKPDDYFRSRRNAQLHNFIRGCCSHGCTQRNWAIFAKDTGMCR